MLVLVYVQPEVHAIELAAICDVFAAANEATATPPHYEVHVVADTIAPIRTRSGLMIVPDVRLKDCDEQAGLLIVAAGVSTGGRVPEKVADWLARQAAHAARYGAIGSGAFLLGAAGLLDGRKVTTHWEYSESLARAYPAARIEADRVFVRDGALFTSAGGMAAMDLLMNLIEEDHGRELALNLAHRFTMFMMRSGGQGQISLLLKTQATTRDPIQRVQAHVRDNITENLSIAALAAVAAMSPRNFTRVFSQETGMRPTDFVETMRVNLARRMLEEGALPPQQIARLCGFSGTESARRAFRRRLGTTMSRYRAGLGKTEA